jgi:hypothetical protein
MVSPFRVLLYCAEFEKPSAADEFAAKIGGQS